MVDGASDKTEGDRLYTHCLDPLRLGSYLPTTCFSCFVKGPILEP